MKRFRLLIYLCTSILFISCSAMTKGTDVFEGTDEMTLNKVVGRTQIMSNPTTYFTFEDEEANEIIDILKKIKYRAQPDKERAKGWTYIFYIEFKDEKGNKTVMDIQIMDDVVYVNDQRYSMKRNDAVKFLKFFSGMQRSTIEQEQLNILEGVSLNAKYDSDNERILLTLQNNNSETIYYGERIILEKEQEDKWYEVTYSGNVSFTDILNYLLPSDEEKRSFPINIWIPVTRGDYRVIMEVSNQERMKDMYYISAEFTISD